MIVRHGRSLVLVGALACAGCGSHAADWPQPNGDASRHAQRRTCVARCSRRLSTPGGVALPHPHPPARVGRGDGNPGGRARRRLPAGHAEHRVCAARRRRPPALAPRARRGQPGAERSRGGRRLGLRQHRHHGVRARREERPAPLGAPDPDARTRASSTSHRSPRAASSTRRRRATGLEPAVRSTRSTHAPARRAGGSTRSRHRGRTRTKRAAAAPGRHRRSTAARCTSAPRTRFPGAARRSGRTAARTPGRPAGRTPCSHWTRRPAPSASPTR